MRVTIVGFACVSVCLFVLSLGKDESELLPRYIAVGGHVCLEPDSSLNIISMLRR